MESFKSYLQNEFERRCNKNKHYSLRSFSKSLDVEPSFLSKLLRGKRNITDKSIIRFGSKLGLSPDEIKKYLVNANNHKKSAEKISTSTVNYSRVDTETFKVISHWYHYAILELTHVEGFQSDVEWIAQRLKINYGQALAAVDRLLELGMLEEQADGSWICNTSYSTDSKIDTHAAFRNLQNQLLDQAKEAMENCPPSERTQTSMTMAINSSRLPEAQRRIREFQREVSVFLEEGPKDRVYQLTTSLFPCTCNKENSQ